MDEPSLAQRLEKLPLQGKKVQVNQRLLEATRRANLQGTEEAERAAKNVNKISAWGNFFEDQPDGERNLEAEKLDSMNDGQSHRHLLSQQLLMHPPRPRTQHQRDETGKPHNLQQSPNARKPKPGLQQSRAPRGGFQPRNGQNSKAGTQSNDARVFYNQPFSSPKTGNPGQTTRKNGIATGPKTAKLAEKKANPTERKAQPARQSASEWNKAPAAKSPDTPQPIVRLPKPQQNLRLPKPEWVQGPPPDKPAPQKATPHEATILPKVGSSVKVSSVLASNVKANDKKLLVRSSPAEATQVLAPMVPPAGRKEPQYLGESRKSGGELKTIAEAKEPVQPTQPIDWDLDLQPASWTVNPEVILGSADKNVMAEETQMPDLLLSSPSSDVQEPEKPAVIEEARSHQSFLSFVEMAGASHRSNYKRS